jgi:PAS domain S-box-containing protein
MLIPVDPNSLTTASVDTSQFPSTGFLWNLLNSLSEPILVKNRQHQWVFLNSAFRSLMGYGQECLIGQTDQDGFPLKEAALFWERDEQQFVAGMGDEAAVEISEQMTNAQGQSLQLLTRRHLFHNETGEPFLVCSFRPVSLEAEERVVQQKQAEVSSRQREATQRALVEALPDLLIRMRKDGTYLDLSLEGDFKPSAIQATLGKTIFDVLPEAIAQERIHYIERSLTTGELQVYDQELEVNGQLVYEEVRIVPSGNDEVLTIVRDITARKQAEMALQQLNEALEQEVEQRTIQLRQAIVQLKQEIRDRKAAKAQLQQQEQFLRSIYQGIEHQIFVINVFGAGDFRYGGWNHFTEQFLKISSETAMNKTPEELFGPLEGSQVRQRYHECWRTGKTVSYEEELTILGQPTWFITTLNPLKDENGQVYRMVGMTLNITDRKQAELALQESERQLRQQTLALENTLRELQRTQTQLIQNEKMSSLGQLVAGIAHEINNPVNFIYGNLKHADEYTQDVLRLIRLYQQIYPEPAPELQAEAEAIDLDFLIDDLPKLLHSMKVGAERIQKIVASLRNFSRMDEAEMKAVNIHEGIDSTLMILQNRLQPKSDRQPIEVVKEYGSLPLVECYAGQLNQVFMNLLNNAIDALEEAIVVKPSPFVPQITIRTELVTLSQIAIEIADNGCGIPPKVQQRMFDPFFTTKPIGKGTGMGLSISYQIVTERHQGKLWCNSTPETGTRFIIEIPLDYG